MWRFPLEHCYYEFVIDVNASRAFYFCTSIKGYIWSKAHYLSAVGHILCVLFLCVY